MTKESKKFDLQTRKKLWAFYLYFRTDKKFSFEVFLKARNQNPELFDKVCEIFYSGFASTTKPFSK